MQLINTDILFKPFPSEDKTSGGIIVSDAHKEVSNKGTVIAVGKKVTKVKLGETVFRCKDWGQEMTLDGEKVFCMDERAILAKL